MKNKEDKEKMQEQKEISRQEAKILERTTAFISISKRTLDLLHDFSVEKKRKLVLDVADITKVCSYMSKNRQYDILVFHLQMINLNDEIEHLQNELTNLEANKKANKRQDYSSKKHQICKEISIAEKDIASIKKNILTYESEVKIYSTALQICSEFGRRLNFYLSVEE